MKQFFALFGISALLVLAVACHKDWFHKDKDKDDFTNERIILGDSNDDDTCTSVPLQKDLLDVGGVTDWGDILVSNDADKITIRVNSADSGMYITRITAVYGTQEHVSDFLTRTIFWTACDGPSVFDRQKTYAVQTTRSDSIQVPNAIFGNDSCIWMSITVELKGVNGTLGCAYASPFESPVFGSAQYQGAFQYCRQDCAGGGPRGNDCDTLRTQTQGGWGAKPQGYNPGKFLHANFDDAFPNGILVGCEPQYFVRLTTAQAVTDLLPAGGEPAVLTQNYIDPEEIKNVLVGQLVALTLNVGFDLFDPRFGSGDNKLGEMFITSGKFKNWTVNDFLAEANKVLGGCSTNYTAKEVQETAAKINENFVDGKKDKGFLACTPPR